MFLKELYKALIRSRWELGLVRDGLEGVFERDKLVVDWIKNPYRDRWFADPFILDVTDKYIYILAEEFLYATRKGRIAKLFVNRETLVIEKFIILLELPTHLSFPSILRKDGKVFVYPESAASGHLDLYEYDSVNEKLYFHQTLCDDAVWDSVISDLFGEAFLFTANKNDHYLDIYKWSPETSRYVHNQAIYSPLKNSRMAGQFFKYKDSIYCPQQDCETTYGGAANLNRVYRDAEGFHFSLKKKLRSPHKKYKDALHTFNVYKDAVVIDVRGYDFRFFGKALHRIVRSF